MAVLLLNEGTREQGQASLYLFCTSWWIAGDCLAVYRVLQNCCIVIVWRGGTKCQYSDVLSSFLCGVCMFSSCLCGFPLGALASSHSPNTCRLIVDSKLPGGVNVSVNGCLSLYASPAMKWQLVQGGDVRKYPYISTSQYSVLQLYRLSKTLYWFLVNSFYAKIHGSGSFWFC